MSNFLIALAVCIITVVGALFAIPYIVDWNGYRSVFEDEATRLLGREVRVGGSVNLHFLPTPYFRFEKVRIADTSTNLQLPFFKADILTVKLSIAPILRGVVEANEIEFEHPTLRLAVDEKGAWNWQNFGNAIGSSPYLPANVALASLKINDGVLALHAANGDERLRIEGMTGELSAPSLDGPYRYRGTFGKGGERELRVSTARPDADGGVPFRLSARLEGDVTYTVEARLIDLAAQPRIEGQLSAHLPTARLRTDVAPQGGAPQGAAPHQQASTNDAAFEVKAALQADSAGASLSDLSFAFEQGGRPQLITGDVKVHWRDELALEMNLASRWLDLDLIAGVSADASPVQSLIPFAARARSLLPTEGRLRASLAVDQATIGREPISGLRVRLSGSKDKLDVDELRMALPGGGRTELEGSIRGTPEAPLFNGSANLYARSLARFVSWATGRLLPASTKGDGPFALRSQLSIAPGNATARNLVADLSGTALYGSAQYSWATRPELTLEIEGPRLDARAFMPADANVRDVLDLLMHPGTSADTAEAGKQGKSGTSPDQQLDASIHINAGELITYVGTLRDVALEVGLKGGNLRVPLLRLSSDEGLNLQLEGEVENAAYKPKGSLRADLNVQQPSGLDMLARLLGVPTASFGSDRARALSPLHLAGSLSFATRGPTSVDLLADGEVGGAQVKVSGRLDGSSTGWRRGPAEVTALIDARDGSRLVALLAPGGTLKPNPASSQGRVLVKLLGIPVQGLSTIADIDAGEFAARFRGQVVVPDDGNTSLSGDLELKSNDATPLARLAGVSPPLTLDGMAVAGTANLAATADSLNLDQLSLTIGGSPVRGKAAVTSAGDHRRVEAQLDVDETRIAKLLTPLLDHRLAIAGTAEAALTGAEQPWPDEPFDASAFDPLEGKISLTSKRLVLSPGLSMTQARAEISLSRGKIEITELKGAAVGGRLNVTARIEAVPAGAEVTGTLKLEDAKLEATVAENNGTMPAAGTVSGTVSFSGLGTSPSNVISALHGSGSLQLDRASLSTLWPGAVTVAVERGLRPDAEKTGSDVKQALSASLSAGRLPLPGTMQVEISDGQLRLPHLLVDSPQGRASGSVSLDLRTLMFNSQWRLEPAPFAAAPPGGPEKPPLPGVSVSYRGPVTALGKLEASIDSEAFERELSVRKMEKDIEELERLRKADELRRRNEAERLRQQFEREPTVPTPMAPTPSARPATPG